MSPAHLDENKKNVPVPDVSPKEDARLRACEIQCRIETDRMREQQYRVAVIRKMRLLNLT